MTTHIIEGKRIIFIDHNPHDTAEAVAYLSRAFDLRPGDWPRVEAITVTFEGDDAILDYTYKAVPFERIRRITGYLVGTTDRFNNAKQAEEHDRVKHGLDYIPVNVCVACGAEMPEGDQVCAACWEISSKSAITRIEAIAEFLENFGEKQMAAELSKAARTLKGDRA